MTLFGEIDNPLETLNPDGGYGDVNVGLPKLISNITKLVVVAAGIFSLINIIIAGFNYMTAGGDEQKIQKAVSSINMSLIGLVVIAGSFIITGIISFILFGDASIILKPTIYGPGSL